MSAAETDTGTTPPAAGRSPYLPLLLLALAVLGWAGFQTEQLYRNRNNLRDGIASQEPQIAQSQKLQAAWESLATRTARLAQAGNANATIIVDELRKRGININPDTPLPPPPPPSLPAQ